MPGAEGGFAPSTGFAHLGGAFWKFVPLPAPPLSSLGFRVNPWDSGSRGAALSWFSLTPGITKPPPCAGCPCSAPLEKLH